MSLFDRVNEQKKKTEEQLARGGGRSGANFWRPENGDNDIRIMPQWRDDLDGTFWRQCAQHWNVTDDQRGPILCPKETPGLEGSCPVCAAVQALRTDKGNTEAQKIAKSIRAKTTYLLNVVVNKDPVYTAKDVAEYTQARPEGDCPFEVGAPKVQIYACPVTIFDQVLGIIGTSQKNITDLVTGRNIRIKRIPNKDPLKTRYECYPDLDPSDSGLKNPTLPALDQVGYQLDYDGMVQLLDEGRVADFAITKLGSGSTKKLPTSGVAKQEKTPVSVSDLEEQMRQELNV